MSARAHRRRAARASVDGPCGQSRHVLRRRGRCVSRAGQRAAAGRHPWPRGHRGSCTRRRGATRRVSRLRVRGTVERREGRRPAAGSGDARCRRPGALFHRALVHDADVLSGVRHRRWSVWSGHRHRSRARAGNCRTFDGSSARVRPGCARNISRRRPADDHRRCGSRKRSAAR